MKRLLYCLLLACISLPATAQDHEGTDVSQNAALRYWVAFNQMGELSDEVYDKLGRWDEIDIEEARVLLETNGADGTMLRMLHWGAQLDTSVWGIEYNAGPFALLPHLGPSRNLARLGMLRARVRLHDGEVAGATDDILAVMKLSHAFDRDRILISTLLGKSIESMAITFMAEHLYAFDDEAIERVADGMARLPDRPALSGAFQGECDTFVDWLEEELLEAQDSDSVEALMNQLFGIVDVAEGESQPISHDIDEWLAWIQEAKDVYAEAGRIADLPYEAYQNAIVEFEDGIQATGNQVVRMFIPSTGAVRRSTDRSAARRAMLLAMFAIRLDGKDAETTLAAMQDPFGEGAFEYIIEEIEGEQWIVGLRSALPYRGESFELRADRVIRR